MTSLQIFDVKETFTNETKDKNVRQVKLTMASTWIYIHLRKINQQLLPHKPPRVEWTDRATCSSVTERVEAPRCPIPMRVTGLGTQRPPLPDRHWQQGLLSPQPQWTYHKRILMEGLAPVTCRPRQQSGGEGGRSEGSKASWRLFTVWCSPTQRNTNVSKLASPFLSELSSHWASSIRWSTLLRWSQLPVIFLADVSVSLFLSVLPSALRSVGGARQSLP